MSDSTLKLRLHAAACLALAKLRRVPDAEISVTVSSEDADLTLTVRPAGAAGEKPRAAEPWVPLFFAALELSVVRVVARGPLKGSAIGQRLRCVDASGQASGKLRTTLANLCERGVLVNDDEGYRLTAESRDVFDRYFKVDE